MPENTSSDPLIRIALGLEPLSPAQLAEEQREVKRLQRLMEAAQAFYERSGVRIMPALLAGTSFDPDLETRAGRRSRYQ